MKLLVINGPNLNLLGRREPAIYGNKSYAALCEHVKATADALGIQVEIMQTNHEGVIVDAIQDALGKYDGIVINPAAYTHTSVAIADAIAAVEIPTAEVHLSDINERDEFRKHSYVSMVAKKTICGLGFKGYRQAIIFLYDLLS